MIPGLTFFIEFHIIYKIDTLCILYMVNTVLIEDKQLVKNADARSLCVYSTYVVETEEKVNGTKVKKQEIRKRIDVDETKLDMFSYYQGDIPDWKPKNIDIPKFHELSTVAFDIETTGGLIKGSNELDYVNHKITLIGIKNEKGKSIIFDCVEDERVGISLFFSMLEKKKPDIIYGHNIFYFDIPFIIGRAEILGLKHPFWRPPADGEKGRVVFNESFGYSVNARQRKYATKRRATCQINSRSIEYNPVYLTFFNGLTGEKKKCAILDTFHEVLAWDYVHRKLTNYRLKECPVEMGLIKDDGVVDLPYEEQVKQYAKGVWDNGGKVLMETYLESDLNLTKILGDYLFPSIYYQRMFIDWSIQSIASSGNGGKWQHLIESSYKPGIIEDKNILSTERHSFKGAYTLAFAGLFGGIKGKDKKKKETCKIDVASLYPTMMLLYGICSSKDFDKVQLAILKWLRFERLKLKDVAKKTGDIFAKQMQGCIKLLINSGYGSLGTGGIPFNDYEAAALVTAYARGVFRIMIKAAREFGGTIVSADTDGIIVEVNEGESKALHKYMQDKMPGKGTEYPVELDLEWVSLAVFVPESDNQMLDISLISDEEGLVKAGLRKNYIIVLNDGELKVNGKYKKRDRSVISKVTQPRLVQLFTLKGELEMRKYYRGVRRDLVNGKYDFNNLKITRSVRKGEQNIHKVIPNLVEGQSICIWKSHDTHKIGKKGQPLKAVDVTGWTQNPTKESLDWDFYIKELDEMFREVLKYI